ncbi:LysR substrate-binding domain-containing protein [Subtercola boreus]|nr:LysR substrate-binding domain-containing protein [Subtercola boreus]TQL54181.1 DNA-binding transcriptional LysR family regulator [Subtercola boreus]
MELRHLRYFIAVAEEQNFGRAASRLFISQSTLSEQIRSLENEVGGPLLLRTSRRVELTEVGDLLLPEARRALAQTDHALQTVRASLAGDLGSIRVGFSGVAALGGLLGGDLRTFRMAHPLVEISLLEAAPAVLSDHLVAGVIDVAYSPDLGDVEGIVARSATRISPIVAVPHDHPFAGAESVSLADLVDQPLIAFASEHDAWAVDLLAEVSPERLRSASSTLGVLALVSAGSGVAVVPSVLECVAMPGVAYAPLTGAALIALVIASRSGETAGTVRELLRISAERSAG